MTKEAFVGTNRWIRSVWAEMVDGDLALGKKLIPQV
jgi:hypothetical protein